MFYYECVEIDHIKYILLNHYIKSDPSFWDISISDIFMVFLTLAYVITTICILMSSKKQFNETIRPKLYLDFKFNFNKAMAYVILKNVGKRSAKDIKIQFDREIKVIDDQRILNNLPFIKELRFLSPGEYLESCIGSADELVQNYKEKDVKITIEYYNENGTKFIEEHNISFGSYEGICYTKDPNEKSIKHIVEELLKINSTIKSLKK